MSQDDKTVKEIRSKLKNYIHKEFERLPETLEDMEPKERMEIIIKLLPYALPKTNKVSSTFGEPIGAEW